MKSRFFVGLLILGIISASSCSKKSDPDPRDRFVGSWNWAYTISCTLTGGGSDSQLGTSTVVIAKASSGLRCTFGTIVLNGTLSNGSITYSQTISSVFYTGTISLNGSTLSVELDQVDSDSYCTITGVAAKF